MKITSTPRLHAEPSVATPTAGEREIYLYVLRLTDGCFYVGQTTQPLMRIAQHCISTWRGSAWTRAHHTLDIDEVRSAGTTNRKVAEELENKLVLHYMRAHGWQRVRGGSWSKVDETLTRKALLHHGHAELLTASRPVKRDDVREASPAQRPEPQERGGPSKGDDNAGKAWHAQEDAQLLAAWAAGASVDDLIAEHRRSRGAITARLVRLACAPDRASAQARNARSTLRPASEA